MPRNQPAAGHTGNQAAEVGLGTTGGALIAAPLVLPKRNNHGDGEGGTSCCKEKGMRRVSSPIRTPFSHTTGCLGPAGLGNLFCSLCPPVNTRSPHVADGDRHKQRESAN